MSCNGVRDTNSGIRVHVSGASISHTRGKKDPSCRAYRSRTEFGLHQNRGMAGGGGAYIEDFVAAS